MTMGEWNRVKETIEYSIENIETTLKDNDVERASISFLEDGSILVTLVDNESILMDHITEDGSTITVTKRTP